MRLIAILLSSELLLFSCSPQKKSDFTHYLFAYFEGGEKGGDIRYAASEDGRFYMVATDGPFRPRHGSVILITDEEYEAIIGHDFEKKNI